MTKIRSINDLAKHLGVSKTTVSFVLSGQGNSRGISKQTQQRVRDAAGRYGFSPSQLARNLSTGRTHTVGFIAPDLSDPFYSAIFKRVGDFFYEKGYVVSGVSSDEDQQKEQHLITTLLKRGVDGILLATAQPPGSKWLDSLKTNRPIVLFDRENIESTFTSVTVDNMTGARTLANHLIESGHRRIGIIYINPGISTIKDRIAGVHEAFLSADISIDPALECLVEAGELRKMMTGALTGFCTIDNPATAVILLNNILGAEALYCINRQWSLPWKPSLACFDDIDLFDYSTPPVTSIVQPVAQIAAISAENLLSRMEQPDWKKESEKQNITIKTELKLRTNK